MSARGRLALLLTAARAAVTWERVWPRLLPIVSLFALFAALVLFDALPLLPGWLHGLVLLAFLAALVVAVRRSLKDMRGVDTDTARHRLERDSGLGHRPLTALEDTLAGGAGDRQAQALWNAHLLRAAQTLKAMKVRLPSPGMARHDPFGLRAAVLLVFLIALAAGQGDATERFKRALSPDLVPEKQPVTVEVWVTPPAYTGMAPLFLEHPPRPDAPQDAAAKSVSVPAGSAVMAQVNGAEDKPMLKIGINVHGFEAVGAGDETGAYRVESKINDGDRLSIEHEGRELAGWPLKVISDGPPEVVFSGPPARTKRNRLRVTYEAKDDFALKGVDLIIQRPGNKPLPGGGTDVVVPLPLNRTGAATAKGRVFKDLTPHPWAGLPVILHLKATDRRGQTGNSEPFEMVLPERIFNHPVARAIIGERKKLNDLEPAVRSGVGNGLAMIASSPHLFVHDTSVFLALSVARSRLYHDHTPEAIVSVQSLLWETALRVEDGRFSIAETELMRAQDAIERALRDDVTKAEMERLMNELSRAMQQFLQAMREKLQREGAPEVPFDPNMKMLSGNELQRMIQEARELMRMGAKDAARQMLADLQRMLNNLRAGIMNTKPNPAMQQARRMMRQMRSLAQRQQQLLERSFKRQQQGQGRKPGEAPPPGAGQDAKAQQALREALGDLMLQMGEMFGQIPKGLGKADQFMEGAVEALGKGNTDGAVPNQKEALEALRQGMQGAAQMMAQRFRGMGRPGMMARQPGYRPRENRDPFGREPKGAEGPNVDGHVEIPTKMQRQRAHDILNELRRRSGDRSRPRLELDYIDRLLRQF